MPIREVDMTLLLYGLVFMLVGKIVWSWLSGKKTIPGPEQHPHPVPADGTCPLHDQVMEMIKSLSETVNHVKSRHVDRDDFKDMDRVFNTKIDSMNLKLDTMNKNIADIRVDVAKLGSQKKSY